MSVLVLVADELALTPAREAEWLAPLPPARQAHIRLRPDVRARHRSLLASRLLGRGLGRLGLPATALADLRYPERARPTLDLPLHFSLSHCAGRVVCALSSTHEVGVDVEALGALTADGFPLYLSAAERTWAGRSRRRFYALWTRKEAVVKAAGSRGLAGLREVDAALDERHAAFDGRTWHTLPLPVGRGHVGHLAVADPEARWHVERVPGRAL